MASHGWRTDHFLTETLFAEGFRFDFFQAVRILEWLHPEKPSVATGSDPKKEAVRFKSLIAIDFPASDIAEIQPGYSSDQPVTMLVHFLSLAGDIGPLPMPYTELILARAHRKDRALKDFLDIFHHRLVSLMYRIRKIYRIGFDYQSPQSSHFADYFFALMGLGTAGLRQRMRLKDRALLPYTALLAQQPRSMCALEFILTDYFRVAVKGRQLKGRWYRIDADQLTRIGESGQNQILGESALLGIRVWQQQARFELVIGPLDIAAYRSFLPVGHAWESLVQLTRFFVGVEFEFDIILRVKGPQVPATGLGKAAGARLGWTSWLKAAPYEKDYGWIRLSPRLIDHGLRKRYQT